MTDSGGGKSKSKRFHGASKPYERRQSFFGSLTDTVKSVVTPSWLTDLVRTVKRSSKNGESPTEPETPISARGLKARGLIQDVMWKREKGREEKEICSSNSSNLKPRTAEYGQLPSNSVPPRTDTFRGFTSGSPVSGNNYTFEVVSKKNESMNVYPSNVSQYKEEPAQVREPVSVEVVQNGGEGEMEHSMEPPSVKLNQTATWTAEYNTKMSRKPAVWKTPGFDVTLFGTSDERRRNAGRDSYHMSPFYSGKTCFGGALSQKSRMNRTAPDLKYPCPVRQKIQPKTNSQESTSTAKRILATLQKMSTPLNDARKIPFEDTVLFDSQTPVAPRGPPRRQLTTPLAASVTKNRQRIRLKETEPAKCQEELPTETKSNFVSDSSYSAGGKLKEKKFSQHISKRGNFYDEEAELPNLRTEFTLPVDNITGMKFGILDKENGNKDKGQRNATDGVFTFSSPVQKGEILNTTSPVPKMNFTFSSPIKVNSPQTAVSQPIKSVGEVKATAEHVFQPSTLKPHTGRTEVPDREVKRKLPVKTWDCDVCLVPNKMENAKCLACESPRSGSQPSTSGFMVKPKSFSIQTGFVGDSNGPANPGLNESSLNGDGIKKPAAVEKPLGKLEKDASPFGQTLNLDRKSKSSIEENSGFKIEKTSESTILKSSGIIVKENESPRKRATLPEKTEQKAVNFTIPASMTTIPNVPVTKESGESNKVAGTFTSPFLSNSTDSATPAPVQFNKMSPIFGASVSTMNEGQTEKNQDSKVLASAPSFPVVQNTTTNSTVTFQFGVNSMKTTSVTSPNFQFGQSTAPNSEEKIQFSVNSSKASSATPSFQFGQSNSEAPKSNASIQFGQSNSEAPKSNASFQFRQSNSEAPKSNASFQFGQSNSEAPKSNASFQFGQSNSIAPKSNAPFQFGANSTVTSSATLSSSFQFSASATSGTSMSAKTVPLQAAAASLPKAVSSPGSMFSASGFNSGSLGNTTVPGSQGGSSINSNFGFAGQAPTFGTSASFEKEKPAGFNFSFGASKPSGAESNSLFQFGNQQQPSRTNENQPTLNGGLNPAPQGLFSFSAAPQPTPPQPSLPAATSFNAGPANPPTAGSPFFNIGASNDSGRRVKKAVRKLKR